MTSCALFGSLNRSEKPPGRFQPTQFWLLHPLDTSMIFNPWDYCGRSMGLQVSFLSRHIGVHTLASPARGLQVLVGTNKEGKVVGITMAVNHWPLEVALCQRPCSAIIKEAAMPCGTQEHLTSLRALGLLADAT